MKRTKCLILLMALSVLPVMANNGGVAFIDPVRGVDDGFDELHLATISYYQYGAVAYETIRTYHMETCQDQVNVWLNNPNAGASVVRGCHPVGS